MPLMRFGSATGVRYQDIPPAAPYGYVQDAGGTRLRVAQRGRCSTPNDFVAAVENLCIIRARTGKRPDLLPQQMECERCVLAPVNEEVEP